MYSEPQYLLLDAMKFLVENGYTNPRGGNGSIRLGDTVWLTPSGLPKHRLRPEDLVVYDLSRDVYIGFRRPSIEINAHILIYRNLREAGAVLHAHTPFSTSLTDYSGAGWWDRVFVEIQYSVGKIGIARPAPPGTKELAENILEEILGGARLVVIPKHGVIAWGKNIWEALDAIVAFEDSAKYYVVGKIATLLSFHGTLGDTS